MRLATLGTPTGDILFDQTDYPIEKILKYIPSFNDPKREKANIPTDVDPQFWNDINPLTQEKISNGNFYVGGSTLGFVTNYAYLMGLHNVDINFLSLFGTDVVGQEIEKFSHNTGIKFIPGILDGVRTPNSLIFNYDGTRKIAKDLGSVTHDLDHETLQASIKEFKSHPAPYSLFLSLTQFTKFRPEVVRSFYHSLCTEAIKRRVMLCSDKEAAKYFFTDNIQIIMQADEIYGNFEELQMQLGDSSPIEYLQQIMLPDAVAFITNSENGAYTIYKSGKPIVTDICRTIVTPYQSLGGKLFPTGSGDSALSGFMTGREMNLPDELSATLAMRMAAECIIQPKTRILNPRYVLYDFLNQNNISLKNPHQVTEQDVLLEFMTNMSIPACDDTLSLDIIEEIYANQGNQDALEGLLGLSGIGIATQFIEDLSPIQIDN